VRRKPVSQLHVSGRAGPAPCTGLAVPGALQRRSSAGWQHLGGCDGGPSAATAACPDASVGGPVVRHQGVGTLFQGVVMKPGRTAAWVITATALPVLAACSGGTSGGNAPAGGSTTGGNQPATSAPAQ